MTAQGEKLPLGGSVGGGSELQPSVDAFSLKQISMVTTGYLTRGVKDLVCVGDGPTAVLQLQTLKLATMSLTSPRWSRRVPLRSTYDVQVAAGSLCAVVKASPENTPPQFPQSPPRTPPYRPQGPSFGEPSPLHAETPYPTWPGFACFEPASDSPGWC